MSIRFGYFFDLAQRSLLKEADPVPLASNSFPCAVGGARQNHPEPVGSGSPYLIDW